MTRTLSDAIDLVLPFVSRDKAREHLTRPARHVGRVVATDGHTLAVARFGDDAHDLVRTWVGTSANGTPVPRYEYVIPNALKFFGEWDPARTPELAQYPAKWSVCVSLGAPEATVQAWIPERRHARSGKVLAPKIDMIHKQPFPGLHGLRADEPVYVNAPYLLRVASFFWQRGPICVHGNGPLDPLVFAPTTCTTKDELMACDRFAIVMPMRM